MGCKDCKDKKNLINKAGTNSKFIFSLVAMVFIVVPWILGANQLFGIIKDFIISLF